jgi:hypothetical protein
VCTLTRTFVVAGDRVPLGHLRSDKSVHLCHAKASPFHLSGTKATHAPREPWVPDTRLRCPPSIDGLGIIKRRQH